jgi:outer membrane protein OmpA-like peptidoglycan-associated protein
MINYRSFVCAFFFYFSLAAIAFAQPTGSTSSKAQKLYTEADILLKQRQIDKGIALMEKAVGKDPAFADAHLALANLYMFYSMGNGEITKTIEHFEAYLKYSPQQNEAPEAAYMLASLYFKSQKYEQAITWLEWCTTHPKREEKKMKDAPLMLRNAKFAKDAVANPIAVTLRPLPANVNSFALQYFPTVTADKQTLVYVARKGTTNAYDEDLVMTQLKNNEWTNPVPLTDINTSENEGTASISGDGRTLVFSSCGAADSKGGCDIYISYKVGNQWTKPENLAPINSQYWDSQPSLSADGKTIYFSSSRVGSVGKQDIWVSHQNDEGMWQTPENLGAEINTPENELAPFIHANGQTLFFSSSGYAGMGKHDLYLSNKVDGHWQTPQNLGYPLNTDKDETSICVTSDGKTAFFGRDQRSGNQVVRSVIGWFEVPKEWNIIHKSNYLHGTVFDEQTKKKVEAQVELIDLASGQKMYSVNSDPKTGEYLMVITEGKNYGLYVNKKGYLFKSLTFDYSAQQNTAEIKPVELDVPLQKIQIGSKTVLNNLWFESGKYALLPNSIPELNKIVSFMRENSSLLIEIAGHTDDVGSKIANLELSRKRAQSVIDYLVQKGIKVARLQAKGYGETQPLNANTGEGDRQLNRRIEFRILK